MQTDNEERFTRQEMIDFLSNCARNAALSAGLEVECGEFDHPTLPELDGGFEALFSNGRRWRVPYMYHPPTQGFAGHRKSSGYALQQGAYKAVLGNTEMKSNAD